jgi:hypothetical protein
MSGRRALALRRFKEEAVLAHVVRSPPTMLRMDTWEGSLAYSHISVPTIFGGKGTHGHVSAACKWQHSFTMLSEP